MAGIPKRKLDYASWSTDIFDNESSPIYDLLDKFKSDGFLIYFYLCQRAYGTDGYFYKWSFENASRTAIKTGSGINGETVKKAVEHCLKIGAFDKQLFEKYGILTNKEIQKNYMLAIIKRSKKAKMVEAKYWLLEESETEDYISFFNNGDNLPENGDNLPENGDFSPRMQQSKVKESKVNKSKENKSKVLCSSDAENQHIDGKVKLTQEQYNELINDYGESVVEECIGSINVYINNNNVKPYNNHYETIIKWINGGKANGKNSGIVHTNKPNNEDSKYSQNF